MPAVNRDIERQTINLLNYFSFSSKRWSASIDHKCCFASMYLVFATAPVTVTTT